MCGASGGTEPTAGLKHSVCVHQLHCGPAMPFLLHEILSQASSQESGFQEKASRDCQPSRLALPYSSGPSFHGPESRRAKGKDFTSQ